VVSRRIKLHYEKVYLLDKVEISDPAHPLSSLSSDAPHQIPPLSIPSFSKPPSWGLPPSALEILPDTPKNQWKDTFP
jgi:hypothetical protein